MSYLAGSWRRVRRREERHRGAPCGADKLGDAVEPVLVDIVDRAVAQELVRHEECGPCVHGRVTCIGRRAGRGQRWSGGAAVPPHRGVQRGCLLLVPRRAGGDVGGRRRGTTRWPADGSRLSDAGGEGSPALSMSAASVRHGDDRATGRGATERKLQRTPTWRAKCRITGSGKTLKVRTLGCARRSPPYRNTPTASPRF